jgi:antitoxin component of RelBE/YafQ-DinJ toxin-antitoxin module
MRQAKRSQINFRMKPHTQNALKRLADKQGVTMTDIVEALVKRSAQRQGVWQDR